MAEVLDLKLQRITSTALTVIDSRRSADRCGYELAWKPALASDKVELQAHPGTWLILSDRLGIGAAIAERLRQRGERCLVARADSVLGPHAEDELALDPVSLDDMRRALLFCGRDTMRPLRGVIHLWGIHAELTEEISSSNSRASIIWDVEAFCRCVRYCRGRQARKGHGCSWRLEGAHAVNSEPVEPAQTAMLGLARTYGLEEPRLQLACVDLDPLSEEGHTEALWTELWAQDGEGQVAYRRACMSPPRPSSCSTRSAFGPGHSRGGSAAAAQDQRPRSPDPSLTGRSRRAPSAGNEGGGDPSPGHRAELPRRPERIGHVPREVERPGASAPEESYASEATLTG